jgi:hypothetical protein
MYMWRCACRHYRYLYAGIGDRQLSVSCSLAICGRRLTPGNEINAAVRQKPCRPGKMRPTGAALFLVLVHSVASQLLIWDAVSITFCVHEAWILHLSILALPVVDYLG